MSVLPFSPASLPHGATLLLSVPLVLQNGSVRPTSGYGEWRIPFDVLMLSTGVTTSGMSKQHMLKYLRRQYKRIGTMVDDSPYNVRGARLQKIGAIHVCKNDAYWANNFELVTKV